MKIIKGIKLGGLQQKIFNLMLLFMLALIGAYTAVSVYQQNNLSQTVKKASTEQQISISMVSEETMEAVLGATVQKSNALQAYIANDLFGDVRSNVLTMQAFATQLFEHPELFPPRSVEAPSISNKGVPSVQLIHENGVVPENSPLLGIAGNMSEMLLAMYQNSDKMSSCFIGTADGNMVLVNDRPEVFISDDGSILTLGIRNRPWYAQAVAAGELIFTGVETDAYTDDLMLECAAPVYQNGKIVAVVAADIYLTAISDYVKSTASEGGFVCVINENGQVLFSPEERGIFRPGNSADTQDLRQNPNEELASFVTKALSENTGLETVSIDGKDYFMTGAPMSSVGWTVISVIDQAVVHQPTDVMLARYEEINEDAQAAFEKSTSASGKTILVMTLVIIILAITGALVVAGRIVKPIEHMTLRINELKDGDTAFEMEDAYRTNDEIEILAESFATLSKRTRDYIVQITKITAEKERIGTELSLATRIQEDMLPRIFPALPDRKEFDLYASMEPAKEVGGDFYDFFMSDKDHLVMVVADVSGKGIPAALFMMVSKIIIKMKAQAIASPREVLIETNAALSENNGENMFVTVWLGILELATGKLTYANAGHEKLILFRNGEWNFDANDHHGVALAALDPEMLEAMSEKFKFSDRTVQLQPGDFLFQYTDGVTEATNANDELFGEARLLEALRSASSADPAVLLPHVRKKIDEFVKDAEQFDDITMLGMRYNGIHE